MPSFLACKLAIRDKGDWVVAYIATMDEKEMHEVSRLRKSVAERQETFHAWIKVLGDDLQHVLIKDGFPVKEMMVVERPKHKSN